MYKTQISYESEQTVVKLCLPRRYTNTHNDDTGEVFLSVGSKYNQSYLTSAESINVESQVVGKWSKCKKGYRIDLYVIVDSEKNPNAPLRDSIFRKQLPLVLSAIGTAEMGLVAVNPELRATNIYIHFRSTQAKYNVTEKWGKLGNWAQ